MWVEALPISASDVTRSAMAFRMGWCAPSVTAPSVRCVMRTSNGPITAQHPDGEAAASVAAASAAETDRQHAAVGVSLPYVKALLLAECSICSSIAGPRTRRDVRATTGLPRLTSARQERRSLSRATLQRSLTRSALEAEDGETVSLLAESGGAACRRGASLSRHSPHRTSPPSPV